MYHIVQFEKTNEVGIVPNTWLHGRDCCFWPNYRSSNQLDRAVKTCCLPDKDTWRVYAITVMYTSESYDKVRRKLPLAADTSNLDTEAEDNRETRKRRPTGSYLSSRSSSSSSDEEIQMTRNKGSKASVPYMPIPPSSPRLPVSSQPPSPPRLPVSLPVAPSPPLPTMSVSTSPRRSPRRRILPEPSNSPLLYRQEVRRPTHSPQSAGISTTAGATRAEVVQLVKVVESTRAVALENQKLLHQVLRILQSGSTDLTPAVQLSLPLKTIEELREANASLEDSTRLKAAVGQLGVAGGVSAGDTVRRVLTMLMTNSVAKQVNWKGTSGKETFQQMKMKEVVIKAARKNPACQKTSDCELESHIKLWFRYAQDRDGGRRERTLLAKQKKSAAAAASETSPH